MRLSSAPLVGSLVTVALSMKQCSPASVSLSSSKVIWKSTSSLSPEFRLTVAGSTEAETVSSSESHPLSFSTVSCTLACWSPLFSTLTIQSIESPSKSYSFVRVPVVKTTEYRPPSSAVVVTVSESDCGGGVPPAAWIVNVVSHSPDAVSSTWTSRSTSSSLFELTLPVGESTVEVKPLHPAPCWVESEYVMSSSPLFLIVIS